MRRIGTVAAAALLATLASQPASAQVDETNNMTYEQPVEEDNDFPWGLLGLLGLAGLIPRKKAPDVHIDNRTKPH